MDENQDAAGIEQLLKGMKSADPAEVLAAIGGLESLVGHAEDIGLVEEVRGAAYNRSLGFNEGSKMAHEASVLSRSCEIRIQTLEAIGMVDKIDELTEQLRSPDRELVHSAAHHLNKIIWHVGRKEKVERVLAVLTEERPKWGGLSDLGDEAYALRLGCEERIPRLSTITELFVQLESNYVHMARLAFAEIRKRAEKTEKPDELREISEKARAAKPRGFDCEGWGEFTEANWRALMALCTQRLAVMERYKGPEGIRPPVPNGGQAAQAQKPAQKV